MCTRNTSSLDLSVRGTPTPRVSKEEAHGNDMRIGHQKPLSRASARTLHGETTIHIDTEQESSQFSDEDEIFDSHINLTPAPNQTKLLKSRMDANTLGMHLSRLQTNRPQSQTPYRHSRSNCSPGSPTSVRTVSTTQEARPRTSSTARTKQPENRPEWGVRKKTPLKHKPRSKLAPRRKGDLVDESLFGTNTRHSIEEEHMEMHRHELAIERAKKAKERPKKTKAPTSNRFNPHIPPELPGGPTPNAARFRKTQTLQGGYEPVRHAKPGTPSHKPQKDILQHRPATKTRPSTAPAKALRSPFIHEKNEFKPTDKQAARVQNNLWGNFPNV
eukprot:m.124966 g.124966  ORF g.124966 m.124966 type:complete len:330 (+) comp14483_c0_seq2:269-1258(+)